MTGYGPIECRDYYTEEEVRAKIAQLRDKVGGVRSLAKHIGVSPSYVSDVLLGRRAPGPNFLVAVGIEKVVTVTYYPASGALQGFKAEVD